MSPSPFDNDFAPVRRAVLPVDANNIVKDARVDHDNLLKVSKIPIRSSLNSTPLESSRTTSKEHNDQSRTELYNQSKVPLNTFDLPRQLLTQPPTQDIPQSDENELERNDVDNEDAPGMNNVDDGEEGETPNVEYKNKLEMNSVERCIIHDLIPEFQNKLCPRENHWGNTYELINNDVWSKVIPPTSLKLSYKRIKYELLRSVEYITTHDDDFPPLLNLVDPNCEDSIHNGWVVLQNAVKTLRKMYPDINFIMVEAKSNVEKNQKPYILDQILSQLYKVDLKRLNSKYSKYFDKPYETIFDNTRNELPNGELFGKSDAAMEIFQFVSFLSDQIKYSYTFENVQMGLKSRRKSVILFTDMSTSLFSYYTLWLDRILGYHSSIKVGYIRLSDKPHPDFVNISCREPLRNEVTYFKDVTNNLKIQPARDNMAIDFFNNNIIDKTYGSTKGLSTLLRNMIKTEYKASTNSLDCAQKIIHSLLYSVSDT